MIDEKATLLEYLQDGRDALLWKLEGLSEYDVRRPLVRSGTNLLGIVKHVASVEAGYLGDTFGRPFPTKFPWFAPDAEPNADMWVTPDESRKDIVDLYRSVWAHSDATVAALGLDAEGDVPWWPKERSRVTLHLVLVRMVSETNRHAGHADVVRELLDGEIGLKPGDQTLPDFDGNAWEDYRARVEAGAHESQLRYD